MSKWVKRIYLGILILVVLVVIAVNVGMQTMKFSDEDAIQFFEESGFDGTIENVQVKNQTIKIIAETPEESDSILLVFVHGAPGTWDAFKDYVVDEDINRRARILAYDRPGYGGSGDKAMPSISDQSEILKEIINIYGKKRNVLVGHSYGGPIVGKIGLDETTNTNAVIMIAPLLDPASEPLPWYSYFSYWKLTSWLLPSELVVAGSEKFAHSNELDLMKDEWESAACSFIHVHGMKDGLAPGKENIEFSKRNIPNQNLELIVYDDKGHLIIWTEFDLMKKIILEALDKLN